MEVSKLDQLFKGPAWQKTTHLSKSRGSRKPLPLCHEGLGYLNVNYCCENVIHELLGRRLKRRGFDISVRVADMLIDSTQTHLRSVVRVRVIVDLYCAISCSTFLALSSLNSHARMAVADFTFPFEVFFPFFPEVSTEAGGSKASNERRHPSRGPSTPDMALIKRAPPLLHSVRNWRLSHIDLRDEISIRMARRWASACFAAPM